MQQLLTKSFALGRSVAIRSGQPMMGQRLRPFGFAATNALLEQRTMKVPTMGDSITEGTIVEWTAQIGQAVQADDVVALVETDKVTVEIKAEINGVVTEHFGSVDDTVEVGADLYVIDTEAEASVTAATSSDGAPASEPTETPTPQMPSPALEEPVSSSTKHRKPSIKFLGKEGWAALKSGKANTGSATAVGPNGVIVTFSDVPPMYGRPLFSEEEMEALILGGANVGPKVLAHSGGAKFK